MEAVVAGVVTALVIIAATFYMHTSRYLLQTFKKGELVAYHWDEFVKLVDVGWFMTTCRRYDNSIMVMNNHVALCKLRKAGSQDKPKKLRN